MARGRDEHLARVNEVQLFGKELAKRCKSSCETCGENTSLSIYEVPPVKDPEFDKCIMICQSCKEQIDGNEKLNPNHWHCLNDTAWSELPVVQVVTWRLLNQLEDQGWAADLLEQMYLEDDILEWAKDDGTKAKSSVTKDSNGAELVEGDTVTVIKDLDVRGANFVAKRGTVVKGIRLSSNPEHIEGKVNGTRIVLKTCFLKKTV